MAARPALESGRVAILDATFSRREHCEAARRFAGSLGSPTFFVETRCSEAVALKRLERRSAEGRDPSDAGPSRYVASVAGFEALGGSWPVREHAAIHTDRRAWEEELRTLARRLGADGGASLRRPQGAEE